jgi:DNA-binding PadR family transcriptional regulator
VVRIFQPAHGYQLRRELLTWNVQEWGNINPGSIYTGLRTLAKHGYLDEIEDDGGRRPGRTSYKLTTDGETEYFTLLRAALWQVRPFHPDQMQVALNFLPDLRRDEVVAGLESRITQLEQYANQGPFMERAVIEDPGTPDHVVEMVRITQARGLGELEWTRGFLERVRRGAYWFAGEEPGWKPPKDLIAQWQQRE